MREAISLDPVSRKTLGRFLFKLVFCLVFASTAKIPYMTAALGWLALYAGLAVVTASLHRVRPRRHLLTEWGEAGFLAATAAIFFLVHRMLTP